MAYHEGALNITLLYHAIENTVGEVKFNTVKYQTASCSLIGCIFHGMV